MRQAQIEPESVLGQLQKVLASPTFQGAGRSGALLKFLVERTIAGRADELKEYTLGAEALGRGERFDPRTDSIARVEASRLRQRLDIYYAAEGRTDPVWIRLPKGAYVPAFERRGRPRRDRVVWWKALAAAALSIAFLALWAPWRKTVSRPQRATRVEIDLGNGVSLRSSQIGTSSVIVSPDGRRLVFVSFGSDGVPRLMTRLLDDVGSSESKQLPGTEGARGPFFSPEGRWVAYLARGKLWKTPVDGGTPVPICDAQELLGGSWGDGDTIVAALSTSGLAQLSAGGGTPAPIEGVPAGVSARWPQFLPGSRSVLFTAGAPGQGPERIVVLSLADQRLKNLVDKGSFGRYLDSGHLAYVDEGTLFVAPFNLDRLEVSGTPVAIMNDVTMNMYGSAEFDVSRTGVLVCRRRPGGSRSVIQWLDRFGKISSLVSDPANHMSPRISPDGSRLAFFIDPGGQRDAQDLRVFEWRTGKTSKVTTRGLYNSPVWTPDSRFLVAATSGGIGWIGAEGGGSVRSLINSKDAQVPWSFDGKGQRLAFYQRGLSRSGSVTFDLWTVPVRIGADSITAGTPEPFVVSDAFEVYPAFSPDGRWIAYTSLESGGYEVYVRPFPDKGRTWQVSSGGGLVAVWSRDGRQLFYRTTEQRIMVVDCTASDSFFQVGRPRLWGDSQIADTGVAPNFDLAPDGRIAALMPAVKSSELQGAGHVTLVLNFDAELRRRVP